MFFIRLGVLLLGAALWVAAILSRSRKLKKFGRFTRQIEFDFVDWTLGAMAVKIKQFALGSEFICL